jgi:hypothetical protein
MSTNSINSFGQLVWKNHKPASKINVELDDNSIIVNSVEQIKTSMIINTWKIVDAEDPSIILMHFSNADIVSFDLVGNSIYLYSGDEIPYVLRFLSNYDAEIANERINNIINGINYV